jgi:hypothetical protein
MASEQVQQHNYTFTNSNGKKLKASYDFVNSCEVFVNMFEDLGIGADTFGDDIPITDIYNFDDVEQMLVFFDTINSLQVKNENGDEMSYLDFMINHHDELGKNYFHINVDPPYCDKILEMYRQYRDSELLIKFINMNTFFNNLKLTRAIELCILVFIRKGGDEDNDEIEEMIATIIKIKQEEIDKEYQNDN